jgi:hypothetical protein
MNPRQAVVGSFFYPTTSIPPPKGGLEQQANSLRGQEEMVIKDTVKAVNRTCGVSKPTLN